MARKIVSGIYKIISPTGKVYIGQSWNIYRRWRDHRISKVKTKLFSSFQKYGYKNHVFEILLIIENCKSQESLDFYEALLMDIYNRMGFELLNLREGGSSGLMSEESKRKMSEAKYGKPGKKHAEAQRQRCSASIKEHHRQYNPVLQKLRYEKVADGNRNKEISAATRDKISKKLKGRIISEGHRSKLRMANSGISDSLRKVMNDNRKSNYDSGKTIIKPKKITASQALEIRTKYIPYKVTFRQLSEEYKVSEKTIKDIIYKKTRKHI